MAWRSLDDIDADIKAERAKEASVLEAYNKLKEKRNKYNFAKPVLVACTRNADSELANVASATSSASGKLESGFQTSKQEDGSQKADIKSIANKVTYIRKKLADGLTKFNSELKMIEELMAERNQEVTTITNRILELYAEKRAFIDSH